MTIWIERVVAIAQELPNPIEVEQHGKLSGRVVPLAIVVGAGPSGESRKGFQLRCVRPPSATHGQFVAGLQLTDVLPDALQSQRSSSGTILQSRRFICVSSGAQDW
jgi:hypothetical protein